MAFRFYLSTFQRLLEYEEQDFALIPLLVWYMHDLELIVPKPYYCVQGVELKDRLRKACQKRHSVVVGLASPPMKNPRRATASTI